jgi:hypothetical protein
VEHDQLVTKGENLDLQGGAGPKTGDERSEKSNQNIVHRGCNHHRTNDDNLCVFKSDGVFSTHSTKGDQFVGQKRKRLVFRVRKTEVYLHAMFWKGSL